MTGFLGVCAAVLGFLAAVAAVVGVAVGVDRLMERFEARRRRRYQPDLAVLAANRVRIWKRHRVRRQFWLLFSAAEQAEIAKRFRELTQSDETQGS